MAVTDWTVFGEYVREAVNGYLLPGSNALSPVALGVRITPSAVAHPGLVAIAEVSLATEIFLRIKVVDGFAPVLISRVRWNPDTLEGYELRVLCRDDYMVNYSLYYCDLGAYHLLSEFEENDVDVLLDFIPVMLRAHNIGGESPGVLLGIFRWDVDIWWPRFQYIDSVYMMEVGGKFEVEVKAPSPL